MLDKLKRILHTPDVRNAILFIIVMMVIFRFAAHVPIPGVEPGELRAFLQRNQVFGLLNLFSGGTLENLSIASLGVAPYITASIILQLLQMVVPKLEELGKEGEYGQRKINQYTRYLTVPLAVLQGFGVITLLNQTRNLGVTFSPMQTTIMLLTMTAGSIFLMWIGELMSEKKVGNGISLLIFAGIVARLPDVVRQLSLTYDKTQLPALIAFFALAVVTIVGVVFITEGQRNVPVSYARRIVGGGSLGGVATYLPLRVNMAGVIPIIFAISIVLFPPVIAQFFLQAKAAWLSGAAQFTIDLFANQIFYGIFYFVLVVGFTFFYTSVVFKPDQIAENLQKQGGFIPGIRPGQPTAQYLKNVTNRIMLAGSLFLGAIAVLPVIVQQFTGTQALIIGGTSLLIVVSVVIESIKQIDSQLTMRQYEVL